MIATDEGVILWVKDYLLTFFIAVSILLCFSGCSEQDVKEDPYNDEFYQTLRDGGLYGEDLFYIEEINGRFYLQFTANYTDNYPIETTSPGTCICRAISYPKFYSLEQMQQHIKAADLPAMDLYDIYLKCDGRDYLQIFDPDKLYDVRLPLGMEAETIYWTGDGYTFKADGFLSPDASVDYYFHEEAFKEAFGFIYTNFLSDSSKVISEKQVASRNATVYEVENNMDSGFVVVQYTIEKADRILYVHEEYDSLEDYKRRKPEDIYIFGEENGGYFQVDCYSVKTRPSVAWLSSFGLEPHEN